MPGTRYSSDAARQLGILFNLGTFGDLIDIQLLERLLDHEGEAALRRRLACPRTRGAGVSSLGREADGE